MATPRSGDLRYRRGIRVRGTVQGVGFRPTVCRFAAALDLGGFVRNDEQGVLIEIEGAADAVARFVAELPRAAPPVARIVSLETTPLAPLGEREFRIVPSGQTTASVAASIPADLAPCSDCLRELEDPANRRFRYPFVNCTACGPRFTIVRSIPYDRARTTMATFILCPACRAEYQDAWNRRFHAEPNACPICGPQLTFIPSSSSSSSPTTSTDSALVAATRALSSGLVVAVKGAGGFLLAADATDAPAVARLRARKRRPHKPLAVMSRTLEALERIVTLDEAERAALLSSARPIVLARLAPGPLAGAIGASLAPGLGELGVFLPSTPLQHLLLSDGPPYQVMTSGNLSEEPIARDNDEARARLAGVADAFLVHDRDIHTRADDSVVRVIAGQARVMRRARGLVPEGIALPAAGPLVLGVGAELKSTVCLTRGREAILSQHLGDLDDAATYAFFEETIVKLIQLVGARPEAVAHDLHPGYRATRWAKAAGLPCVPVQHHHAHVASCLVEHGRTGSVLGVAFDGTGFGPDGTLWGGELLLADLGGFTRLGHLRPLPLLGGEAAIRAPWRLAAAALFEAGEPVDLLARFEPSRLEAMRHLWKRPHLTPSATGAGRWFDAVAALCGLRADASYEGQAAMELEAVAVDAPGSDEPYDFAVDDGAAGPFVIDLRPTVRAICEDLRHRVAVGLIAARFHQTLADAIAAGCRRARHRGAPETVALSGGCFQNRLLTERTRAALERLGFEVLLHRRVPCNDGGLALGQAAIAAYRLATAAGQEGAGACA
jgi:hydrogenase maturation protein HypF